VRQRARVDPERDGHLWPVHRPLVLIGVAIAVASPIVVGGLTLVLVAHALAGTWLRGGVAALLGVAVLAGTVAAMARWSRAHPDAWQTLIASVARERSGYPVERSVPTTRNADPNKEIGPR
jgi:hypothetical protein